MSRNRIVVKLSFQNGKGFKKGVGFYRKADGTRMRKVFWLGHSRAVAERLAITLLGLWERLRQQGLDVWPDGNVLEDARKFAFAGETLRLERAVKGFTESPASLLAWDGQTMPAPRSDGPSPEAVSSRGVPTVHAAVSLYEQHLDARVPHQLSAGNAQRQKVSLKMLKAVVGDVPLPAVGVDQIHRLVQHACARPKGPRGGPIAVETVVTFVQHFRQSSRGWTTPAGGSRPDGSRGCSA